MKCSIFQNQQIMQLEQDINKWLDEKDRIIYNQVHTVHNLKPIGPNGIHTIPVYTAYIYYDFE